MNIGNADPRFVVREMSREDSREGNFIRWRYKSASHFLIVVCDASKKYTLEQVQEILASQYRSDEDFLYNAAHRIYKGDADALSIYLIPEEKFQKADLKWELTSNGTDGLMSFRVEVFSCEVDTDENNKDELVAHEVDEYADNVIYVPLRIRCTNKVKKNGIFGKSYYSEIRIFQNPANYQDGDIVCVIGHENIEVPIPKMALCKNIYINLPTDERPMIRAAGKAKDLYIITEEGQ